MLKVLDFCHGGRINRWRQSWCKLGCFLWRNRSIEYRDLQYRKSWLSRWSFRPPAYQLRNATAWWLLLNSLNKDFLWDQQPNSRLGLMKPLLARQLLLPRNKHYPMIHHWQICHSSKWRTTWDPIFQSIFAVSLCPGSKSWRVSVQQSYTHSHFSKLHRWPLHHLLANSMLFCWLTNHRRQGSSYRLGQLSVFSCHLVKIIPRLQPFGGNA